MTTNRDKRFLTAMRLALGTGLATALISVPVANAAEEGDAAELERVQVTGSRITRQDLEGATPVTVFDRTELDMSGEISVADFLRDTTFNSFGSFREISGSSAQSQATLSLRGVGSGRTLILVNGRRLPGSPVLGGSSQNLNTIPMAAVERIDILRDGASAIYGSDAVGGVVNIVLRDDYEGMQINVSHGDLARSEADEMTYNIVGGINSNRGNVTWTVDHSERGLVYNREGDFEENGLTPAIGISDFGYPGSVEGIVRVVNNPVTGEPYDVDADGDPIPRLVGYTGVAADPRCPTELGDPVYPNSRIKDNGLCGFNFASVSASLASTKRTSLSVMSTYDINSDVEFFGRFTYSRNETFGVYAPAPAYFSDIILPDNPNYPTGLVDDEFTWYADPDEGMPTSSTTPGALEQTVTGPFPLGMYFRAVPVGTRDGDVRDYQMDIVAGLRGFSDLFGGTDWEVAAQHNRFEIDEFGSGYGLVSVLEDVIASGQLDVLGVNQDTLDQAALDAVAHTTAKKAEMIYKGFDGQASMDLFAMPHGTVAAALGFEYADESYVEDYDAQSSAGNVFGSAGNDTGGGRTRNAVFAEFLVPLLPGFEANVAVRRDDYSDFGTTTNPKVSFRWTPTDELLFRASYGESFIAPSLGTLYAATSFSAESAIDTAGCQADGGAGERCTNQQYNTFFYGAATVGADLQPETAENFTLGTVWSPDATFSVGVDYYNIVLNNVIVQAVQPLLDAEAAGRALPTGTQIIRSIPGDPSSTIREIHAPPLNGKGFETDGIDLDVQKSWELGGFGTLLTNLQYSLVLNYDEELLPNAGVNNTLGLAGRPEDRAKIAATWLRGPFSANLQFNYLPATTAGILGDWESDSATAQARLADEVGAWNTVDLQFGYATPWAGKITVGARNVTDEAPPLSPSFGHPYYDTQLYNPYGRVTYVRYTQDF